MTADRTSVMATGPDAQHSWQKWFLARVAIQFTATGDADNPFRHEIRRIALVGDDDSEDERAAFYKELLKLSWIRPKVRSAILKELGTSLRAQKNGIAHARAVTLQVLIAERKAQMRTNGQRPWVGIHEKAVGDIADEQGMSVTNLKKLIQLHGLKGEERRQLQAAIAQRYRS